MASRRRIPKDMAGVKKSRAALAGAVTRSKDKLQAMPSSEPEEVATLSLPAIQQIIDSLDKTKIGFNLSLDDAQKYPPSDEEQEEAFLEAEDLAEEQFSANIAKVKHMAESLITLKHVHNGLDDFRRESKTVLDKITDNPSKLHDSIARLTSKFDELNLQWKEADLGPTHSLRYELDTCLDAIMEIKLSATTPESATSATTTTTASSKPDRVYYPAKSDLPSIDVPHFDGSIMGWSTFWAAFRTTIDTREGLSNTQKLHYLRQAITDPDVSLLLYSPTETEDMYLEVVKELKGRFDKTKEVHREVVKSILQLQTPKITRVDLRRLSDSMKRHIDSLKAIKHYEIEPFLTSFLYSLLPYKLQQLWDQHIKRDKDVPPVSRMLTFLRDHAESLTGTSNPSSSNQPTETKHNQRKQQQHKAAIHITTVNPNYRWDCSLCQGEKHPLYICPIWNNYSVTQRLSHAKDRNLCHNCLIPGHSTTDCRNKYRCRQCNQLHHTTLHQTTEETSTPVATTTPVATILAPSTTVGLMPTAQVLLRGPRGKEVQVRALIDCGAGASLISNRIVKQLNLQKKINEQQFSGAQGTPCASSHHSTIVTITPTFNRDHRMICHPSIVEKVVVPLPTVPLKPLHDLPHLVGLRLADENCHIPGEVDLLLGSEMLSLILTNDKPRIGHPTQPVALNTALGWILTGPAEHQYARKLPIPTFCFTAAPVLPSSDQPETQQFTEEKTEPASGKLLPDAELPNDAPNTSAISSSITTSTAEIQPSTLKTKLSQLLPDAKQTSDVHPQTDLAASSTTKRNKRNTTAAKIPDDIRLLSSTPAARGQPVKNPPHRQPRSAHYYDGVLAGTYQPSEEVSSATEGFSTLSPDSARPDVARIYDPGRERARPPRISYLKVRLPDSSQSAVDVGAVGRLSYPPDRLDFVRENGADPTRWTRTLLVSGHETVGSTCDDGLGLYDPKSRKQTLHSQDDPHQPLEDETRQTLDPQTDGSPNNTTSNDHSQLHLLLTILLFSIFLLTFGVTFLLSIDHAATTQTINNEVDNLLLINTAPRMLINKLSRKYFSAINILHPKAQQTILLFCQNPKNLDCLFPGSHLDPRNLNYSFPGSMFRPKSLLIDRLVASHNYHQIYHQMMQHPSTLLAHSCMDHSLSAANIWNSPIGQEQARSKPRLTIYGIKTVPANGI